MKHILFIALAFVSQATASLPDGHAGTQSPSGFYLIQDDCNSSDSALEHHLSIARKDQPTTFYRIYKFPRFYDLYFSPDERYLVIDDHNGSGSNTCVVLTRIDKPPYYAKLQQVDGKCWSFFWSNHRQPRAITYGHQQAYFCEWLTATRFIVGLQGNGDVDAPIWYLEGGWHCIYDASRHKVSTDKYVNSKNTAYTLSLGR